jgi:hypothetical protein
MAEARFAYIMVITHSDYLVSQGVVDGEREKEGGARRALLTARMGEDGVEFEMDGRQTG